jgi:hypothetical protein
MNTNGELTRMDAKVVFVTPASRANRFGGGLDEDSSILPLFFFAVPF